MNTMFRASVTRIKGSAVQILRPAETGDALALLKENNIDVQIDDKRELGTKPKFPLKIGLKSV